MLARLIETYLSGLLEWLFVHSNKDDSMRSEAIFSRILDISDEILARAEVDKLCGAELL